MLTQFKVFEIKLFNAHGDLLWKCLFDMCPTSKMIVEAINSEQLESEKQANKLGLTLSHLHLAEALGLVLLLSPFQIDSAFGSTIRNEAGKLICTPHEVVGK